MKLACLHLLIVWSLLNAQPVAFVDLSVTPRTPRPYRRASSSNQGGGCFAVLRTHRSGLRQSQRYVPALSGSTSAPPPAVERWKFSSQHRQDGGPNPRWIRNS